MNVWNIIKEYDLIKSVPEDVLATLREGDAGLIEETLKPADVDDMLHYEIFIGSVDLAMNAMTRAGKDLGYRTIRSNGYLEREIEIEKRQNCY